MSAWQFAFVCSRVLAVWLATVLSERLFQWTADVALLLQGETGNVFRGWPYAAWWGLFLFALAASSLLLWTRASSFARALCASGDDLSTRIRRPPWERSVVFFLGLWLLTTAAPEAAGLLANVSYQWGWHDDLLLGAYGEYSNVAAVSVRVALGLLLLANSRRVGQWASVGGASDVRTDGVTQPSEDKV